MKKILLILCAGLFVYGCEETKPNVFPNTGAQTLEGVDTTYRIEEADVPDADFRGILVEDLTGVRCVACPNAAEAAAVIKENSTTNEVVILGLYPTDPKVLTSPYSEYPDLRTEIAQDVAENIFDFANLLPGGGVNRVMFNGESRLNITYTTWANRANSFTGEKSIVNIAATAEESTENDTTINLSATFNFTGDAESNPRITLFLLEDDIKHPQKTQDGKEDDYKHKHVVRKSYTPYNGSDLLTGDEITEASRGTVVERGWKLSIPSYVNLDNASIAILVSYSTDETREVIQCTELKLR